MRQEDLRKLREMNEARDAEVAQLKVEEEQMRLREEELVAMVAGLEVQVSFIFVYWVVFNIHNSTIPTLFWIGVRGENVLFYSL